MPTAVLTLAHLTGSALPLPTWLVAYGTAFTVVLVFLVLRTTWLRPRLATAAGGSVLPDFVQAARRPIVVVLRILGVVLFGVVVAAALFGVDDDVSNLAPYALITFWLGLVVASAVIADVWRALDPFPPLASAIFGRRLPDATDRPSPGLWPAVVVVGSFLWFQLAYHSPLAPRGAAMWLVVATVAAMVGAALWGRSWLRDDEGFAGLFGLVAGMAPLHARPGSGRIAARWPFTGLAGDGTVARRIGGAGADVLLLVAIGAIAFDGINNTNWWLLDVLGSRRGWSRTLVSTAGLVFFVGVAAIVWFGAVRWAARRSGDDPSTVAAAHVPTLVPVVLGYAVAHYVAVFLVQSWNAIALASDPFGEGWDLFGTIDWIFDYSWLSLTTVAWIGVVVVAITHLGAALVVHDRTLTRHRSVRAAANEATPFIAVLALSAAVGILYVSGG